MRVLYKRGTPSTSTPPTIPFLGNSRDIDSEVPAKSFLLLAKQYGAIYKLRLGDGDLIICNSAEFQMECSDEKRFYKGINAALTEVRNGTGDGLFTALSHEPNWGKAHRLLMPAFGPAAIRNMYPEMVDICEQLTLKWERFGPNHVFDPVDDYTKLTLDTICLCAMSYRLNSFYTESVHPFVQAMTEFLTESGARSRRPGIVQAFMRGVAAKYEENIKVMADLAKKLIADRKAHPQDNKDMLDTMLYGEDPKTGEKLSDENIRYNLLTFLIAGHETTSGLLGFATYYLIKYPEALAKVRAEIDEVVGDRQMKVEDISKMPYMVAVMRETLRLAPTAFTRGVICAEDTTVLGGKYSLKKGDSIRIQTMPVHRDPAVWGEDAEEFKPERMLDGKFEKLPPNAWQPFGFGMRGCIGRGFALQEAHLVLVSVFQKFDLVLDDPSYVLAIKQTLTIKPDNNFRVRALPRRGHRIISAPVSSIAQTLMGETAGTSEPFSPSTASAMSMTPLYVLYGSNTGSSEAFAQRLATDAASHGFRAVFGTLDSAVDKEAKDGPVVIITASFEGEPADNAAHFVEWLSAMHGKELEGTSYAVFGCGNKDWGATYQRIPKLIDEAMEARGGKRLVPRGEGDASTAMFFQQFDQFEAAFWAKLAEEYRTETSAPTESLSVEVVNAGEARPLILRQTDAAVGTVISNRILTKPGAPEKRHIEFELPEDMTYQAGDYLAILPYNPSRDVHRALARFKMSPDQEISLSSVGPTSLPVGRNISVNSLLSGYIELSQPATTRDLTTLISKAPSDATKAALQKIFDAHAEEVVSKRLSVLDILEAHPDIDISFATFLGMLPMMRIRQYSISSSSLWDASKASLTVSVLDAPAISGRKENFLGVASTFLAGLRAGDRVHISVRPSSAAFHLPPDPSVPVVMFCAGSGLAPFRGFVQERAMQKRAGREVGKMLLFIGCRNPTEDYLYIDAELSEWAKEGVVDLRPAFSRVCDQSKDCKYVQDRVWLDKEDIKAVFAENAKFYSCGSRKMATGVREKLVKIIQESRNCSDEEAQAAFERVKGRYSTDIFD